MTEEVKIVLSRCIASAFSDETWRSWGFPKRPKHGWVWDKFRPNWRVNLEAKIFSEIIITHAAIHVAAGVLSTNGIDELTRVFTNTPGIGAIIGYNSNLRMQKDILEYAEAPEGEWLEILMKRLRYREIKDKKLAANILICCAQFSVVVPIMINKIRKDSYIG